MKAAQHAHTHCMQGRHIQMLLVHSLLWCIWFDGNTLVTLLPPASGLLSCDRTPALACAASPPTVSLL